MRGLHSPKFYTYSEGQSAALAHKCASTFASRYTNLKEKKTDVPNMLLWRVWKNRNDPVLDRENDNVLQWLRLLLLDFDMWGYRYKSTQHVRALADWLAPQHLLSAASIGSLQPSISILSAPDEDAEPSPKKLDCIGEH